MQHLRHRRVVCDLIHIQFFHARDTSIKTNEFFKCCWFKEVGKVCQSFRKIGQNANGISKERESKNFMAVQLSICYVHSFKRLVSLFPDFCDSYLSNSMENKAYFCALILNKSVKFTVKHFVVNILNFQFDTEFCDVVYP